MKKNTAGQTVSFQAISTTDGSAVTTGTPAVYVTIDGGSQGTGGGTTTHEGNGCWSYACEQADTNGTQVSFTFVLTGAVTQTVNVYPTPLEATIAAGVPVTSIAANAINAAAIADDAITAAKLNTGAITADAFAANAITNAAVADDVDVNVKTITAGAITAAAIATDAIDADAVAADAITAIWAKAMSDLAAVPGATASVLDAINLLFELARNKLTQTADTQTLYKDNGSTALATSTVSDDATTFTRTEFTTVV
jgi:hypothetical protein